MSTPIFHPAVAAWFGASFAQPTEAQREAWPAIQRGENVLIAAPTGSGKTLAAFLAAIDALVRRGVDETLADETYVVYVSPLKALSNDVRINLEVPLAGIRAQLERMHLPDVDIRTAVRTGDTPQAERAAMRKRPPHIVVTTPESLYILLGSDSGRRMLATTRTVIVDEIHALVSSKRGSHLALTLERLDALCGRRCTRIGLSATQKPVETVARFLVGVASSPFPHPDPPPQAGEGVKPPQAGEGDRRSPPPSERDGTHPAAAAFSLPVAAAFPLPPHAGEDAHRNAPRFPVPSRAGESAHRNALRFLLPPLAGEGAHRNAPASSLPPRAGEGARRADGGDRADGGGRADAGACTIIDAGHQRARDLAIELTAVPLQPVMSNDAWGLVYDRLAELIGQHRTTLVFANTRRSVERVTRHLAERLGKDAVAAHHGSLSKEKRLDAERRLKSGQLRALVATASLELGIDIGDVDLVCQLSSPRSIAAFLQRAGRAGHAVDGTSKARLFPASRDDLAECVALLDCVRRGELDTLRMPDAPLDVLAQQIVAEVACGERGEAELFELFRRAWPYRELSRGTFTDVVRMLAEGYTTRRGVRAAYLHRDAVHGRLRARRGARLTALTSGGAIPDTADYDVMLEPESLRVGSINEDFAVESMAGDIFQLGNQSYRILRIQRGRVQVEDAKGAPPSIPFWFGEAPGRSNELSFALSRLREEIACRLSNASPPALRARRCAPPPLEREGFPATAWLVDEVGICESAARQLVDYYAAARIELGLLPTQAALVMERFFDESGGMQLVIHSPYGSRLNRAWGLALRKRFCRSFNFELQAAATEDTIVLSLSTSYSFPLDEVARYLHSNSVANVLTQALLDAPMFALRFRWNAGAALALPRFQGGAKVPPPLQRMKSEDLLATVFPDQVACLENIVGDRKIPDHPLVAQTLKDCLDAAMDLTGLTALLKRLERGEARIVARDLTAPSSLAAEVLGARPYAFLDGGELQERRTQAAATRGAIDPGSARDLGILDGDAIAAVGEEAWPEPRDVDEMHEALLVLGAVNADEAQRNPGWCAWLEQLAQAQRATRLSPSPASGGREQQEIPRALWVAAEMLPMWQAVHPDACLQPSIGAPAEFAAKPWTREEALVEILRARLGCVGVTDGAALSAALSLPRRDIELALVRLEREGTAMRGRFTQRVEADAAGRAGGSAGSAADPANGAWPGDDRLSNTRDRACPGPDPGALDASVQADEWCDRHLLARIHRRTLQRLRREIEPVAPRDFARFLLDWQHVAPRARVRGPDGLVAVLAQLEGFEAAAGAWETHVLPARIADYDIAWLDALCGAGRITWTRLRPSSSSVHAAPVRASPVVLLPRSSLALWNKVAMPAGGEAPALSSRAQAVADFLATRGASFFGEIADGTRLLQVELEDALGELVATGLVGADSFAGLRALLRPAARRRRARQRRLARRLLNGIEDAGRWSLTPHAVVLARAVEPDSPEARGRPGLRNDRADARPLPSAASREPGEACLEHVARVLLRRWGIVFWKLLEREAAWLPAWRDLRRVYQRFEARGEIRGGRFVQGVAGEQFALPEAVAALRGAGRGDAEGELVAVSGADPLNLAGIVLPGERVPALATSRVVYRDGVPVATRIAGEVTLQPDARPGDHRVVLARLTRPAEIP